VFMSTGPTDRRTGSSPVGSLLKNGHHPTPSTSSTNKRRIVVTLPRCDPGATKSLRRSPDGSYTHYDGSPDPGSPSHTERHTLRRCRRPSVLQQSCGPSPATDPDPPPRLLFSITASSSRSLTRTCEADAAITYEERPSSSPYTTSVDAIGFGPFTQVNAHWPKTAEPASSSR